MNREDARALKPGEIVRAYIDTCWRWVTVIEPLRPMGDGDEYALVAVDGVTDRAVGCDQMSFS